MIESLALIWSLPHKHVAEILQRLLGSNGTLTARIAKGTFWVSLAQAGNQASAFVRIAILAHLLGPADFGIFGVALLVINTLSALTEPGLQTALIQRQGNINQFLSVAFTFQIIRSVVLAATVLACAPLVGRLFDTPNAVPVIQVLSMVLLIQGLVSSKTVFLHRDLNFRRFFLWNFGEAVAGLASAVLFAVLFGDIRALVGSLLCATTVRVIGSYIVAPWRPRLGWNHKQLIELGRFGRWVNATNIVVFASMQADNAFVGKVLGPAALGIYQVVFGISQLAAEQISHVVSTVAFPSLSTMANDIGRLRATYLRLFATLVVFNAFVTVVLFSAAEPLIRYGLGAQWIGAVSVLRILVFAGFLRSLAAVGGYVFYAVGTPHLNFRMNLWRIGAFAVVVYPCSQIWGVSGVAVAVSISLAIAFLVYLAGIDRVLGLSPRDHLRFLVHSSLQIITQTLRAKGRSC